MSVKHTIAHHTRDYTTSKETWTTLKDLYKSKNTNRVMSLKSRLLSIEMEENKVSVNSFQESKILKINLVI
jgi:hypothetical protein